MVQEGLHPPEENEPTVIINVSGQILQSPYIPEIKNTSKGRKINMDSRDIRQIVIGLSELLSDAERIQEDTSNKVDELTEIKDGLEEANSDLSDAVAALEGLEDIVEKVEGLLNDADNEGIN